MYLSNLQEYLENFVQDKEVLDVGFAGDKDVSMDSPYWVHKLIRENAKYVLGMDYDRNAVQKLKALGYNCIYGNAQNFNLNRKFDVIFAGELIEHLENPGLFLECAKRHLKKGGLLIITTPNQFSFVRFIGNFFGILNENKEHVSVHNEKTLLHLLERKGFLVNDVSYFTNESFYNIGRLSIMRKLMKIPIQILERLRPKLSHQLLVIASV